CDLAIRTRHSSVCRLSDGVRGVPSYEPACVAGDAQGSDRWPARRCLSPVRGDRPGAGTAAPGRGPRWSCVNAPVSNLSCGALPHVSLTCRIEDVASTATKCGDPYRRRPDNHWLGNVFRRDFNYDADAARMFL